MTGDIGFLRAAELLPDRMRRGALGLRDEDMSRAEELRLRTGFAPCVLLPAGERELPGSVGKVSPGDIASVLERATGASAHTALASMKKGFFTVRGGCRIGICGCAITREGEIEGIRNPSSLAIRIPREHRGCGRKIKETIDVGGRFSSTLIISRPGGGKTTLLRDMVRLLSNEGRRVSLADERGEVAAVWEGVPQFDVVEKTDILTGGENSRAVMLLLRGMNPEIIALDEITAPEDILAIEKASNCGVSLLATAHAEGLDDLERRPLYRALLEKGIFRYAVVISEEDGYRETRVLDLIEGRREKP